MTTTTPKAAQQAKVQLVFRWAPSAQVEWTGFRFDAVSEKPRRVVRLATVHKVPSEGTTTRDKCELFAPLETQWLPRRLPGARVVAGRDR